MGRDLNPKCKQCRRESTKLFLKGERCFSSKCALTRRSYIPGIHGPKNARGVRLTGYGTQLREKQKAKRTYRILERQFKKYFAKAFMKGGETGENFYRLLESRLDNAIYKAGLCSSRDKARQAVNHGHIRVNGKKVTIPSYQLKVKDKISIKPKSLKDQKLFEGLFEKLKNQELPHWLVLDTQDDITVIIVDLPDLNKEQPNYEMKPIIEYYSR